MLDGLMQGADRDLLKIWQEVNAPRFDNIMLKTIGGRPRFARRYPSDLRISRGVRRCPRTADLRPGAASGGPHTQRLEDRG
jgi:hypothetical protein